MRFEVGTRGILSNECVHSWRDNEEESSQTLKTVEYVSLFFLLIVHIPLNTIDTQERENTSFEVQNTVIPIFLDD